MSTRYQQGFRRRKTLTLGRDQPVDGHETGLGRLQQHGDTRHDVEPMSSTTATREELKAHRVPLAWRDQCSALLLPLNVCRKEKYYLPWECENERHAYEKYVFIVAYFLFLL